MPIVDPWLPYRLYFRHLLLYALPGAALTIAAFLVGPVAATLAATLLLVLLLCAAIFRLKERRHLEIRQLLRQRIDEVDRRHEVLGKAAVAGPARELGLLTQVLPARRAEAARAARGVEPRDADPPPHINPGLRNDRFAQRLDRPHHLVAGNQGAPAHLELALHDVQVGAADAAGIDLDQQMPRGRGRGLDLFER